MGIESDQLLWLALAATAITLLFAVLMIAVSTRKIRERLLELDALKRSIQASQGNLTEIRRVADRTLLSLQQLSGIGLHFRQIKVEHLRLSKKLNMISSAIDALGGLLQLRDDIKRERNEEIKEIAEASRSLQEWRSRVSAVYSDAGHLFESEPIRELIDQFGSPPTSHTAGPPGRSDGRTGPSQKRTRPRRQR